MKKVLLLLADGFEAVEASVFTDVLGWNKLEGDGSTNLVTVGKSGILNGRNATTYNLLDCKRQKQLAEFGANVISDVPIVIDKNIITSYNPSTAFDVAFKLLELLTSEEIAKMLKS